MGRPNMAGSRDVAVQKLRDVTIAIVIAAAAGVGLIAWVSAVTIPGSGGASSLSATPATGDDDQPFSAAGDGFTQGQPGGAPFGPRVAVTGGSR